MAAVAAEYQGRVRIVGVPSRGDVADMREFVAATGTAGMTHVVDTDGVLWQRFGIVGQPAFADIAADGAVAVSRGGRDAAELRQAADALLAPRN